jgi:hypothetical protein
MIWQSYYKVLRKLFGLKLWVLRTTRLFPEPLTSAAGMPPIFGPLPVNCTTPDFIIDNDDMKHPILG